MPEGESYADRVPVDAAGNKAWRESTYAKAAHDERVQRGLWQMCKADLLFYLRGFGYVLEPRKRAIYPFIPWGYQEPALAAIRDAIGKHDLVIEKSRDMGASWMIVAVFEWFWKFHDLSSFLLLSRKEELVEGKKRDPRSLFSKFDFLGEHQPGWMRAKVEGGKMHRYNKRTGSTMDGESTNEFAGAADRRLALLMDEFAKMANQRTIFSGTQHVSDCRIFNFTPVGAENEAYKVAHDPAFRKLTLHWSQHPLKRPGLYRVPSDGNVIIEDEAFWLKALMDKAGLGVDEARYRLEKEGYRCLPYKFVAQRPRSLRFDFRSPWYDVQCARATHPMEIAQELDIDYLASDSQYFDTQTLQAGLRTCREPVGRGELDVEEVSGEVLGWNPIPTGRMRLWMNLDGSGRPPPGDYSVGVDVSAGTGASNSCISVINDWTGEEVAVMVTPHLRPDQLAVYAVGICKWLHGARLIWEAAGPGREFGSKVAELGYGRIFLRPVAEGSLSTRASNFPGWWPTKDNKRALYGDYKRGILEGPLTIRCAQEIEDCRRFIFTSTGWVMHSGGAALQSDPSGARENHGDIPTATALAWKLAATKPVAAVGPSNIPVGSLAWRMKEYERTRRQASQW